MSDSFSHLLKTWRKSLSLTQSQLSEIVGTTSRIISYLETGKEKPTKQMVERLSKALSLSGQSHIDIIKAAGFNITSNELDDSSYYQTVLQIAETLIKSHDPFPAIVIDSHYNVLRINEGMRQSLKNRLGRDVDDNFFPISLIDMLFHPRSVVQYFTNRDEVVRFVIQRYHRERMAIGKTLDVEKFKQQYPYFRDDEVEFDASYKPTPQLTIITEQEGMEKVVTSAIHTTVGLPHDLGGDAIRVIVNIPVNDETKTLFEGWSDEKV